MVVFLQQYDSPAQVFANPVNMFVASFIGSPAMSLIPLEASTVDGRTVLTGAEGWTMALSPLNARKVQHVDHQEGRAWRAPLDNQADHPVRLRARSPPRPIPWNPLEM